MSSLHRIIHPRETYRFSTTHTLSDYPLLIGEVLRRDQHRATHKARRRAILDDLQRALGIRVFRDLGTPKIPSWREREEE